MAGERKDLSNIHLDTGGNLVLPDGRVLNKKISIEAKLPKVRKQRHQKRYLKASYLTDQQAEDEKYQAEVGIA